MHLEVINWFLLHEIFKCQIFKHLRYISAKNALHPLHIKVINLWKKNMTCDFF